MITNQPVSQLEVKTMEEIIKGLEAMLLKHEFEFDDGDIDLFNRAITALKETNRL